MNVVVEKYGRGKSVAERIRLLRLWRTLAEKTKGEEGTLPTFGKTAIAFIRKMQADEKSTANRNP